jgi:hypothetical protein
VRLEERFMTLLRMIRETFHIQAGDEWPLLPVFIARVEFYFGEMMDRCSSIPLGSRERSGCLYIQRSPNLPHTYTYDEERYLIAM